MNWKTWIPFVLALAMGLLAAKVGRDLVLRSGKNTGPSLHLQKAVTARADLDPGHVLEEADLVLADFPAQSLPRTAFTDSKDLVGRVLVQGAVKGQVLVESFLAPTGSGGGPQVLVPHGMRAISIEVNEVSGVAGLLAPGCYVDVVSTFAAEKNAIARTIVQNVKVLAVGQRVVPPAKKDAADESLALARSVTLIVTPHQAELIELAGSSGRMRLVLRGPLDRASTADHGVSSAELFPERPAVTLPQPQTRPSVIVEHPAEKEKRYREVHIFNGGQETVVRYEIREDKSSAVTNTSDLRREVEQP